ncbi:hypothetical protein SYNTR_0657 [Candidatus Syntrophocurvum alkaliphilum]|uniref:Putative Se/S carrier protein-like domain-containing protein n=1 Tax=Candidatus Syntrophocurvum alkaliphilum TaxID=2293317 RepID=A0A6I6DDY5_9FIRM|nr:DUF3343 domain-containing protein [Candidatus Syntrophocurvum alkaliphilum]QGT99250.1 hypothetical protein SYNTR_0657 [Candidatus Syntrophocurvum alkaliphilum]
MSKHIINLEKYYLITFTSTSHALKAEKVLKKNDAEFVVMPTLREISTSCGLSIKIPPNNYDEYQDILVENKVSIEDIYLIEKISKKKNNIIKL